MIGAERPVRAPRHRSQPRLDGREPRPVRAHGRRLRGAGAGRRPTPGSPCCRSARSGARAMPGSSARPSCSTSSGPQLRRATSRARTWSDASGRCRRLRRGRRATSSIKFFEGLSTFIFDLLRTEFRPASAGPLAYLLLRPGHRPDPHDRSTTRSSAGRRCSASRGTVIITHGRAKRRMIGFAVGVGAAAARARIARAHRRGVPREPRPGDRRGRRRRIRLDRSTR